MDFEGLNRNVIEDSWLSRNAKGCLVTGQNESHRELIRDRGHSAIICERGSDRDCDSDGIMGRVIRVEDYFSGRLIYVNDWQAWSLG